jgi:hypothetical protein
VDFDLALDKHHLERLSASPLSGITELIWNALDADATEIEVEFSRTPELDGIEEVRVVDNGHGIPYSDVPSVFGALGGSWKQAKRVSPGGRPLHGRDGRGRFRAAGIGARMRWRTVADDPGANGQRSRTTIELRFADLMRGHADEPEPTGEPTGTKVVIDEIPKPPSGLGGDGPVDRLTATFALQLQSYGVRLTYDHHEVDPAKMQTNRADYEIEAEGAQATLTVVEWGRRMERGLYLCDENGTPLRDPLAPSIHAPGFEFTAYLRWAGFAEVNPEDLLVAELNAGEVKRVIDAARDRLREHFKARAAERTLEQIAKWKAEKVYPYEGEPAEGAETTTREVFDVVALSAASVVNESEIASRRFSLRLLKEALESDPGSLHRILSEVLDLPADRLEELSAMLNHTPLAEIIATSKAIANRLEFLAALEQLVLDHDIKKHVKERSQLHRILAAETWVFGEEYALTVDDESLTSVLRAHLAVLGREELANETPVADLEGHQRIVDLMLVRTLPQARQRREHLVVELKAPTVKIGDDEASQIRKYATAVAGDARFSSVEVTWDFIVVSGEVTGSPFIERQSENRPFGQLMDAKGIRVWVLTWGEVIDAAQHRLKFVQRHLQYQPNAQQALEYLRQTHNKYLPKVITDPA